MSGKTSQASKDKYNQKIYKQYIVRVRKNTDLYNKIERFNSKKGTSLNYVITKLLCGFFNVEYPASYNEQPPDALDEIGIDEL